MLNRREFIKRVVVSSVLLVTGVTAMYEIASKLGGGQPQVQTIGSQQVSQASAGSTAGAGQVQTPAGYVFVAALSALSGKTSAYFQHPSYGASLLVDEGSQWKAFSATCTHAACTVQYAGGSSIRCPCHGATFSTSNGGVLGGPAPRPLPEYGVTTQNGNLFVTMSVIN